MPPTEEVFRRIFERMDRLVSAMEGPRTVFHLHDHPPLVVEHVEEDSYKLGHYLESSPGEIRAAPEMLVRFDRERKRAHALYYRDDVQGVFNEVYQQKDNDFFVDVHEQNQQNRFLEQWLSELEQRGIQVESAVSGTS
jgi:uncharacterized protein YqiB (DUF1249 family)